MSEKSKNIFWPIVIALVFFGAAITSAFLIGRSNIAWQKTEQIKALQVEEARLETRLQRSKEAHDRLVNSLRSLSARRRELEANATTITNYITITNKVIPIRLINGNGTNNVVFTLIDR